LYNTKVVDIRETHFTSSGWNKIGYYYSCYWANELVSKLKSNVETEYRSVTNVYFQTTIAPSNKAVVILNASEKEKW
jgi:hypothetical protein